MKTRLPLAAGLVLSGLMLAACGSEGAGADVSAAPAQTSVIVKSGETAPFALQAGRYKFAWVADGCPSVNFDLKQQDGPFDWTKQSKVPRFSSIVNDVTAGTFAVTQSEAACPSWTVTLDWIGH